MYKTFYFLNLAAYTQYGSRKTPPSESPPPLENSQNFPGGKGGGIFPVTIQYLYTFLAPII